MFTEILKLKAMKWTVYLLVGSLFFVLTSCNEVSDGTLSSVKTSLTVYVPFTTGNMDNLKSSGSVSNHFYTFSGEQVFTPKNIQTDLGASNYKNFKPLEGAKLSLPNVLNVEELHSLILEWSYETTPGNYTLPSSIDLLVLKHSQKEGNLEVSLGNSLSQMIETMGSNYNTSYKILIKGNSNLNLSGIANLEIPLILESDFSGPRLELW